MSGETGWISIVDWEKEYQHYDPQKRLKDPRGPMPWVKNYTRLMQNDEYLELSLVRVVMLHRLWLVYAQSACRLRADTRQLTRRLAVRVRQEDLDALNHAGFIDIVASKEAAEGYIPGSSRASGDRSSGRGRSTSAGQSRSETTTEPGPAEDEASDNLSQVDEWDEEPHELVRFHDGDSLAPIGDTVEELRQEWGSS